MTATRREFDFRKGEGYEPFVLQLAQQVLGNPGHVHCPLFILGPRNTGKSQYLKGITEGLNERFVRSTFEVIPASQFRREYLEAYRTNQRKAFVRRYGDQPGLLLDDLQELADSPESLAALASIANTLLEAQKPIVFTSSWTPRRLKDFLELARRLAPLTRTVRLKR